jgi:hypothetical protein
MVEWSKAMNVYLKRGVVKRPGDLVSARELETSRLRIAWLRLRGWLTKIMPGAERS